MNPLGTPQAGLLEDVLTVAGLGCWHYDPSDQSLTVSGNFPGLLGHPAGTLPSELSYYRALTHPDDRGILDRLLDHAGDQPIKHALRLRQADNLWSWFEVCSAQRGAVRLLTFRDISQQRQIEAAARDSQLRYRALYSTAPLAFVLWDRQGYISEWNRHAEQMFRRAARDVIGKRVHNLLLPPDTHAAFGEAIKDLLQHRSDGFYAGPAIAGDGYLLRCNWYNVAIRSPSGQLLGILSLILDVTPEHVARRHLEKSETTYRALVETSPDAILLLGLNGSVQMANQQACQLFGLDRMESYGRRRLHDLFPNQPGSAPLLRLLEQPDDFAGFIASHDLEMHDTAGRRFIATTTFTTISDPQGQITGMVLFARDISERLRAELELEEHRRNLERLVQERTHELRGARDSLAQIIDGTPMPAFVIDRNHLVTHWNKACEQIVGVRAEQMIGTRNHWQAFYDDQRPVMADLLVSRQLEELPSLYGGQFRASPVVNGGFEAEGYFARFGRWLFFTAVPLYGADGEIIGAIETLQDITERKAAEDALKEAMHKAESAANAKADFLANMSHEIRTPINAVIGLAHLLLKMELSGKQQDYVARIHGAGQMLLGLINDILDFSKIEAGCMTLEATEFAIDDVLDNVATVVVQRAQEKGLEVHYVVAPELPPRLIGDPLRLSQILVNLVGNAIKFTARGAVTIYLRSLGSDDGELHLEVSVQDTGIGMSREQQDKLFVAFSQADSSITRKFGGSGLGLTICKRLVELMGGNIRVDSQPGVGSTFSFAIRVGIGQTTSTQPLAPNRRVLVVDDNPLARNVLIALLAKQGCQAIGVESGEMALEILASSQGKDFDYITLDLNMPGMDGLELAQILRERFPPRLRLVLITAADTAALSDDKRLKDIDATLNKPVTAAQIARLFAQETRPAPRSECAPAPLAGLRVLVVEDIPTNQLIACEMLESLGVTVNAVNNGREAVEEMTENSQRYDLILMDIQMPEMDGLEATRRLRAPPLSLRLPIIAMTAHALEDERQRCLANGMNDFLTKPIDPEQLQRVLAAHGPSAAPPPPARPTPSAGAFPALAGIDTTDGLRRMMNKPALYEKVLRDFHIRFRDEAAAIRQALASGEGAEAERRAHSAKGLAGSIGAHDLQQTALALETVLREGSDDVGARLDAFSEALDQVLDSIAKAFTIAH